MIESPLIDWSALSDDEREEVRAKREAQNERLLQRLAEHYITMPLDRQRRWSRHWRQAHSAAWCERMRERIARARDA